MTLGGACSFDLAVYGPVSRTDGTLPAPGPYRPCGRLDGHDFAKVRLSGDGRRLAALTTSGVIIVLDSRTLAPLAVLERARGPYTMVALSGNGAIVAGGADVDGEVDVWRVVDRTVLRAFDLGPTWPTLGGALALSADGTRIVTAVGSDIVVATVATGATRTLPASRLATALYFVDGDRKLAFAGGGHWAAGTGNALVEVIDIASGEAQTLDQHDDIFGTDQLEASADGNTLLVFGHGELAAWDVATARKTVLPQPDWTEGRFAVLGLSADGSELAASLSSDNGRWFQRRRTSDDTVIDEIPIDGALMHWFGWSSRERVLVAGATGDGGERRLASIDTATPKLLATACARRPPGWPLGFSADGRLFVRDGNDVTLFDVATGEPIGTAPIPDGPPWPDVPRPSPDGRWIAWTTADAQSGTAIKRVYVAEATGIEPHLVLERSSSSYGMAILFSPDSSRLAVVDTWDGVLTVVDVETGAKASEVSSGGQYAWPLAFTPDGSAIVFRDGRDNHILRTVRWSDGATPAEWMVVGDDVTAGSDGTVVAFGQTEARTYRDGALLATMPGINDSCFGFTPLAFLSADGSAVGLGANCSRPHYLRQAPHVDLRETATGALIQQTVAAQPLAFASNASLFADASGLIWCR